MSMRFTSIFSGAAFRAALLSLIAFILALAATGLAIHRIVETTMYNDLQAQLLEELVLFQEIQKNSGDSGLIEAVAKIDDPTFSSEHIIGLFGENKELLAGNAAIAPDFVGTHKVKLTAGIESSTSGNFYLQTATASKSTIVIGRNTHQIEIVLDALAQYLALAGLVMIVCTGLIGYKLSRRVDKKLQLITDTLDEVSQGDMQMRLPIGRGNDQIDRASARINTHLDQLALLMGSTRNTINAIAHDLRTPLSRVHMLLQEALQQPDINTNQQILVEDAVTELDNVNHIFDTVLRISKISASHDTGQFEIIDTAEFLQEIIELMAPVVEVAEHTLGTATQTGTASTTAHIQGDRRMLKQMMVNLIENAVHYCPPNSMILLNAQEQPNSGVCLEVSDNGPGIPIEEHINVTKAFYRLQASRSTPGNGLGLALVAAIASRHGATLHFADNAPGLRVLVNFPTTE